MSTSIKLDNDLIKQALSVSNYKTEADVVAAALKEFVERRECKDLRDLFGSIQFADGYDYKAAREGRNQGFRDN